MNTELTNISNKIQQQIADKADPRADPNLVMIIHLAGILQDFVDYLDGITPSLPAPTNGVVNDTDNTFTFDLADQ